MAGNIITIEGLDGAGKSTQIELLVNYLTSLNIKHKFIHFPMLNKGAYGKIIAEFLRGEFGSVDDVHPKLVALMFAEDRNEHKNQLLQWLDDGNLIIMDRYVNSNIAFQCAKTKDENEKEALKQWILDFEFNINKLPKPDASFFLHVPFDQIKKSLSTARSGDDRSYLNGKVDIHENSEDLQEKVLIEYKKMISEQPDFFEIDCFSNKAQWLSPQEIHANIVSKIKAFVKPL
jgi:dTMP kinase